MTFTDAEQIKILETFLTAENYDELGTLLNEVPNQLDVNTVRNAYTSKNNMINQINSYVQTPTGRAKIYELLGEGNHTIEVNNKITENVNTFWENTGVIAQGTKRKKGKKRKTRRGRGKSHGRGKSRRKRRI